MFGFKKNNKITYDKETEVPVIKSSICTGEKTAGFMEINGGRYHDVILIKNESDIEEFKAACGVDEIKTIY